MTPGERRLAERLEARLDDDYLVWYDVPVGPQRAHPDFVVLHPGRGLLVLEVKDWRLDSVRHATRQSWEILAQGLPKQVINPIEQARHYAHQVVDALARDPQLVQGAGAHRGALTFPWSYGVVFTRITRQQFDAAGLTQAIEANRVICADEMTEAIEPEDLQSRLWDMFPRLSRGLLTLPQIDRVRWILFPEVRIAAQPGLFDDTGDAAPPELMRVMDLQQEQLARSLGDGHRVIHGVAGSGKTLILACRAEQLAQGASPERPVLLLCYNEALARRLDALMEARGLGGRVVVRHFHKWCRQLLVSYGQALPPQGPALFDDMVARVIRAVERGLIPTGQYRAVLVDEGHDFQPAWLKLVVQMVDPASDSLLLLYDDAQSIYGSQRGRGFSFRSVGIQARGRTTVLKVNYRNTRQVLELARRVAAGLLGGGEGVTDDDGIPQLQPVCAGREGPAPQIIRLPTLRDEAVRVVQLLAAAHEQGTPWAEMAILCRRHAVMEACAVALRQRKLPHQVRKGAGDYDPCADSIKVMTMHACKGLEFSLVALPGIGQMPEPGEPELEEARLFYVAATRSTQSLIVTASGDGGFAARLAAAGV